jgi:hypothetical protein
MGVPRRRPPRDVRGKVAILVDDGLATGASMLAAVTALRQRDPAEIVAAVPVAPPETCRALSERVDRMICALTPRPFRVGRRVVSELRTDGRRGSPEPRRPGECRGALPARIAPAEGRGVAVTESSTQSRPRRPFRPLTRRNDGDSRDSAGGMDRFSGRLFETARTVARDRSGARGSRRTNEADSLPLGASRPTGMRRTR